VRCYAIGYQGVSVQVLCDRLAAAGVDVLIDVRERAWSNRPEYRKTALSCALAARGIRYEHIKEAGNPFRPRGAEKVDRETCLRNYQAYIDTKPQLVAELRVRARAERVAFFCYESSSDDCHRGVLLDRIVRPGKAHHVTHL
jgi:uncharacterized protein (DUF488 family)